jgi:hypothetical protein
VADEKAAPDAAAFDPKGKSLPQRVDAFIADVNATYSIVVTKDDGRTAEWQQKHHVAHMFLYNKYQSTTPANIETGERLISWAHFSDPKVVWASTDWADFLRTKTGDAPKKTGTEWTKGSEPDKDATKKNVKSILVNDGIGSNGEAMVASGLSPCGEPCKCGAGRSNHLSDQAADLNSAALTQLTQTLTKLPADKALDLDAYLKRFGLHRPLLNHPTSPEKWHVEALPET